MKRIEWIVVGLIAIAGAANAVTLSVVSDKPEYAIGETITLTATGDSQGAADFWMFGQLEYSAALTQTVLSEQTVHTSNGTPWTTGAMLYGDGYAWAFNQLVFPAEPVTVDQIQIATVTLTAQAGGVVDVSWTPSEDFYFFGLTSAPGTSFTILGPPPGEELPGLGPDPGSPIPEPSAALVFAVGLIAACAARRGR